jgi:adenosine deaminase
MTLLPVTLTPELERLIQAIPKVELHVHIEGTLEPELVFELAKRNDVTLPFASADELRKAYQFEDLQSFLNLYYQACAVLQTKQDFYDMTMAYMRRSHKDNLAHAEIFVDPQSHTSRGVPLEVVLDGMTEALKDAQEEMGMTHGIIVSILRHLDADSAMELIESTLAYREENPDSPIIGIGLDSSELDHPPSKFIEAFAKAREHGMKVCAHAGEEGPASYILEALDLLKVDRIDHGVRCLEDEALVERLVKEQTPLTVCPHSNIKLCVFETMKDHNIRELLQRGLCASIHSDDPSYFSGYISDNFRSVTHALDLQHDEIVQLAKNAINASFLDNDGKAALHARLERSTSDLLQASP